MNVQLHVFKYRCAGCGHWYRAGELPEGSYGQFLLRSTGGGSEAYLDALEDRVFPAVTEFVRSRFKGTNVSDRVRSEVVQGIFGATCDPDTDGSLFQIGQPPRCPACDHSKPDKWESTEPPEMVVRDIPHVTHLKWNALADSEKTGLLSAAVGDWESLHPGVLPRPLQ